MFTEGSVDSKRIVYTGNRLPGHSSAFGCGEILHCVETVICEVRKSTDHLSVIRSAQSMGSICHNDHMTDGFLNPVGRME